MTKVNLKNAFLAFALGVSCCMLCDSSSSNSSWRRSLYLTYGCDQAAIPNFLLISPLRLVERKAVTSMLECAILCSQERSREYPLFALVYKKSDDVTSWGCHFLTIAVRSFPVYEIEADLRDTSITPSCPVSFPQEGQTCDSLQGQGQRISWVNLRPDQPDLPALCDFDTDGGGWTVIQRRQDGSENFNRGWEDYKVGFGSLSGEFWFGLENIRAIVTSRPTEIRFDMRTALGKTYYAVYENFWFKNESEHYQMSVGAFTSGDADDSFSYHNNARFDTKDNMPRTAAQCPERFQSVFWYHNCHLVNPNGLWGSTAHGQGINWGSITSHFSSLAFIEIKLRPMAT